MVEEGEDTEAKVAVAIVADGRLHYFSRTPTGGNRMYTGVDKATCIWVIFESPLKDMYIILELIRSLGLVTYTHSHSIITHL